MHFNLDNFMQRLANRRMLEGCKVPAVDFTQGLQILAENNIIAVVVCLCFYPVIDTSKVAEVRSSTIVTLTGSARILKGINNSLGTINAEKFRGNFKADCIKLANLIVIQVLKLDRRKERSCGGHWSGVVVGVSGAPLNE